MKFNRYLSLLIFVLVLVFLNVLPQIRNLFVVSYSLKMAPFDESQVSRYSMGKLDYYLSHGPALSQTQAHSMYSRMNKLNQENLNELSDSCESCNQTSKKIVEVLVKTQNKRAEEKKLRKTAEFKVSVIEKVNGFIVFFRCEYYFLSRQKKTKVFRKGSLL